MIIWNDKYLIVILYDKNLQTLAIGEIQSLNFRLPFDYPSPENIDKIHDYLYEKLRLNQNDSLLIVPVTEGNNESERFEKFDKSEKNLWRQQIMLNIQRHLLCKRIRHFRRILFASRLYQLVGRMQTFLSR
jgi:hypothetical protein